MDYGTRPQRITCRYSYLRTVAGILKLIELVCDAAALILGIAAPTYVNYVGHRGFFIFVAAFAIIVTALILLLAMLNCQAVCIPERWPLIELVLCALIAVLYFIGSIIVATLAKYHGVYGAAAFFGFAAFIVYTADAIYRLRLSCSGPAGLRMQTQKTTTTTTTTITRPEPTY